MAISKLRASKMKVSVPSVSSKIQATAVDNELYILAHQHPSGSYELLHVKSGYHKPADYTVYPDAILPRGKYELTMIGINWGGPQDFKVAVTSGGQTQTYQSPSSSQKGANWTKTVQLQV